MPYVARDSEGNITAVSEEPTGEAVEQLPAEDPELADFLLQLSGELSVRQRLVESDIEMARVTEDLVEVLIEKNMIMLTDLPKAAQEKIIKRRSLRERVNSLVGLVDTDDIL